MSSSLYFRVCRAWHAPLFGIYNLKTQEYDPIGVPHVFGRATTFGAHYTALANHDEKGKLTTDSSIETGSFYPQTVFVFGQIDEGVDSRPLRHKIIRKFALSLLSRVDGNIRDVVTLGGYSNNVPRWEAGVRYTPPHTAPDWPRIPDMLAGIEGLEILGKHRYFIEVMFETIPEFLDDGAPLHEARLC